MKWSWTQLGVILLLSGLMISYSNAWGADWKEFADATTGSFYYDAASIHSPSTGIGRVWIHNVTKHETSLIEFNCRGGSYRVLDLIEYDEAGRIKNRYDYYDNPNWLTISPKSVPEPLRPIVCP
jgi:hypothetical protein